MKPCSLVFIYKGVLDVEQMITNLGFPIACVCALGYYFVQKDKSSREDINKILDNLREDNQLVREL